MTPGKRNIRILIMAMSAVVIVGFTVAGYYYRNLNRSVDPRIREARRLYEDYNRFAVAGDYELIFLLLDSIEEIYTATEHYRNSFETGVLHNNRAAAMLTIALHRESISPSVDPFPGTGFDSLLSTAEAHILKAIDIYRGWQDFYAGEPEDSITLVMGGGFMKGLEDVPPGLADRYMKKRIHEILDAAVENDRRLSVCYSNLGLIWRHRGDYAKAAVHYQKALEMWDQNMEAENNLNLLLGKPPRQKNLLQKLFPPGKMTGK